MFPAGPDSLRVGVLGNGSVEPALSDADGVAPREAEPVDIEPVNIEPDAVVGRQDRSLHCVVVESGPGVECSDVVEECADARPELPVVALTNGAGSGAIAALEAGADETLPAAVTEEPELLADRVVSTVERERARDGLEELYDGVTGGATLHDPETGELLRANRWLCEALGCPREELEARSLGDLTADVPGYDGERAREVVSEAAGRAGPVTLEWPFEAADGTVRWTDSRVEGVTVGAQELVLWASTDATERRQLEQTYRELFESVSDGLVVHDPETGEIRDVNDRFCELTGYDRTELVGERVDVVTAPDHAYEGAMDRIAAAREEGPQLFEWHGQRKEGETFPVEVHLRVVEVRGEERVLASVRDITDRREREERLEEQRRLYSTLVEQSPNGVMIVQNETVQFINPQMERLAGQSEAELLGRPFHEVMTEEYRNLVKERYERRTSGDQPPRNYEVEIRRSDGERRIIDLHVSRIQYRGEPATLATFDDVTERRRQERKLRESERRFQLIADHIDEVIYLATADFSEILYINDTYEEVYGRPVAELDENPTSFVEAAHPEDRARYEEDVERLRADVESGEPRDAYDGEYRIRRDGKTRWVTVTRFPVEGEDGTVDRIVGRVQDITERKRREQEYEQVFNSVQDAIVVHDPETGEMVDANDTFCDLLGYDRGTVLELGTPGVSVQEEGYTRGRAEEVIAEVLEEGQVGPFEWKVETADGDHRVLEVVATTAEIGGEQRHVSINRDVTERKRREREYEQIFNSVNDAIAVFDPETGEITDVNDTYREMLGYDDLETIRELGVEGLSVTEEGYTGERGEALIGEVAETGEPTTVEWRGETKGGKRLWLEATLAPGTVGGEERVLSIQRDVTERKRREQEYEQVFNGVPDPITVNDPETGEMIAVNDAMCETVGYDSETVLERGLDGLSVTEEGYTSERAGEIIDGVMESGEAETFEWKLETAEGDHRVLEVTGKPATVGGEERYISLTRDVTEQRRTERRLEEILERIDEAIFMTRVEEITAASRAPDYVSSGYEEIWGQPIEAIRETYEEGFFGTLHPDDAAGYRAFVEGIVEDIAAGEAAGRYAREYRIERPDGELRWVHSDYYPTAWETGSPRVVIVSRDVTERKARERRIASFDDATEDLATADTPAEATRTAVEAAAETLELPAVGAFLYDDEEGVLRPAVTAGPLPEAVAEPVGPGDGPLWEGFATGAIVAPDGGGSEPGLVGDGETATPAELADLAGWRALALGNHGVLLVGSPDRALGAETIQAAHVLAATLEAALNHLEGQQRLEAQQEQLRTQTERAERLDRIARLTQQVEAAITDASTPSEVERAVCRRLAGSGPYDLAWVGGVEVGTDRLAARAVVGVPDQYVGALDLSTEGTADPHPAVTAWRTDDLQVADSLVDSGPAGDWRRRALSEGYQSLCAAPLTYDGVTHGVLTVGVESPNAFGDRERDVLAQLGTSIANALAAVERRRALESDETVELEFRGEGEALPFARAAEAAGCRVGLERTATRQDGSVGVYFSFEGDVPQNVPAVARRTLPGSVDVVAEEPSSTLVEVRTDDWFGSPLAEYGGVLREASAEPGETSVAVEVPTESDVRSFVERLQSVAPSLELVARRQHSTQGRTPAELSDQVREALTDRQLEVLRTALSAGYFEWPRENDGSEVASRLDITQPTLNKHLRLAERKVFGLLFGPGD